MSTKSKGTMSLRDGPCRCGAGTYRWRRFHRESYRPHRRCEDCDLTPSHCKCVVRLTVHLCPPSDSGIMPCCGLSPFEALTDRMTLDPRRVTCAVPPDREAGDGG